MEPKKNVRRTGRLIRLLTVLVALQWVCPEVQASVDTMYVEVASDSVELGDILEIRYTLENVQGQMETPQFDGLYPMGGPNTSTSMQMINGATQQRHSISYLTKVTTIGTISVPAISAKLSDGRTLKTIPIEITSLPSENTDIEEHRLDEQGQFLYRPKPKKTLKTRKI